MKHFAAVFLTCMHMYKLRVRSKRLPTCLLCASISDKRKVTLLAYITTLEHNAQTAASPDLANRCLFHLETRCIYAAVTCTCSMLQMLCCSCNACAFRWSHYLHTTAISHHRNHGTLFLIFIFSDTLCNAFVPLQDEHNFFSQPTTFPGTFST